MSELDEESWCAERGAEMAEYMARQPGSYGAIGEWPAWHIAPKVSIWAIESVDRPGWVGWWGICDDPPTDYCRVTQPAHPRKAMTAFVENWSAALSAHKPDDATLGETGLPASLAPFLQERLQWLREWLGDDDRWPA